MKQLKDNETDLKRREMTKIAELKDKLLDTRRRIGSEKVFMSRWGVATRCRCEIIYKVTFLYVLSSDWQILSFGATLSMCIFNP